MKKRLLTILLSLSMVLALMPAMAFAGEGGSIVAKIGEAEYETLAAALLAANSGDTIEVQAGTWGSDAIGSLTTPESASVRSKTLTIQPAEGASVKFTSSVSLGYDDSSTTNASMTVQGFAFENASLAMCNYVKATVEDCTFTGGGNSAGTIIISDSCCANHKTEGNYPKAVVTVKNCKIDGSATNAPGIRIRNSGDVVIEGNTIKNTKHNGILFETNTSVNAIPEKSISVTGNTISEWNVGNADEGGRAIRASFNDGGKKLPSGSTVTITGNTFTKEVAGLDSPDFVKITGDEDATTTLNDNCWNGATLIEVKGNSKVYTCKSNTIYLNRVADKKFVAKVGDEEYSSLSNALLAAANNDTIEVQAGTWGAKEIGSMTTSESASVRSKSLTIQPAEGASVKFTSSVSLGYDDSTTTNASMTVKGFAFENASLGMCNYVKATVEDCTFTGGGNSAGTIIISDSCCANHKTTGDYPKAVVTIKNCKIDGSATNAPGIRIRNSGDVVIEGNTIKNTKHNGILFETNASVNAVPEKSISITGNTISEWNVANANEGGRAIRASFNDGGKKLPSGSTVTITGNTFAKETLGLDSPDFVKITGVDDATVDLSNNDWCGAALAEVRGNSAYYTSNTSPATNTTITSVKNAKPAVVKIGDDEYTSLSGALKAAKAGDTLELQSDISLKKSLVIDKTITFDANGKNITAENDIQLEKAGDVYGIIAITANATVKDAKLSFDTISQLAKVDTAKFAGIAVDNASATIDGCTIDSGVTEKSQLGIQNGYAVYAVASDANTLTVKDTKIEKFNKGGIYAMSDKVALVVDGCDIVGFGLVDCQAQNGIVAKGTLKLKDTSITKIGYSKDDWGASGILCYGSNCEIEDAEVVMENAEDYAVSAGDGSIKGADSVFVGIIDSDGEDFEITAGSFDTDVIKYVPKGYSTVKKTDGDKVSYVVRQSSEVIGEQQKKIDEQQETITKQQTMIDKLMLEIKKLSAKIDLMGFSLKASVTTTGKTATVKWNKASSSDVVYEVAWTDGTSEDSTIVENKTSLEVPVELGKSYTFTVTPAVEVTEGEYVYGGSSETKAELAPAQATAPKVTNIATKKLESSWTEVEGAAKYQLSVSTSSSTSKVKVVYTGVNLTYTKASLTKNKTYYVRVRAVGENGLYGAWSGYTKIKVKK